MEKERWENKTLAQWNDIRDNENARLPNILGLITHPKFEKLVKAKDNTELNKQLRILRNTIKKHNTIKLSKITGAMLDANDMLLKMKGEKIYKGYMDPFDIDNVSYIIDLVEKENKIDLYAKDVELIVGHEGSFDTIAKQMGLNKDIIYKVKGMFR